MNPSIGASRFKASFQNYQWEEAVPPANRACGGRQGRRGSRGLREQPILLARRGIVMDAWTPTATTSTTSFGIDSSPKIPSSTFWVVHQ
ncbi:unnamed protein product [Linum trigynum]|uniref:Uncharacterized protein n=1 Tax=Linum trigynum TaxID=586398 RepID=A0AAV2FTT7_9ROSI